MASARIAAENLVIIAALEVLRARADLGCNRPVVSGLDPGVLHRSAVLRGSLFFLRGSPAHVLSGRISSHCGLVGVSRGSICVGYSWRVVGRLRRPDCSVLWNGDVRRSAHRASVNMSGRSAFCVSGGVTFALGLIRFRNSLAHSREGEAGN